MKKIIFASLFLSLCACSFTGNQTRSVASSDGSDDSSRGALNFECKLNGGSALIKGMLENETVMKLHIIDDINMRNSSRVSELGINRSMADLSHKESIFESTDRKNESTYKYRLYVNGDSASQNFLFSIPKKVLTGRQRGEFIGYWTVENDTGDFMAPSESLKFSCRTK